MGRESGKGVPHLGRILKIEMSKKVIGLSCSFFVWTLSDVTLLFDTILI